MTDDLKGRELLDALGPALAPARALRYRPVEEFDDVDDEDLERAERALRALAYSCQQGATLLRRAIVARAAAEAKRSSS